jgi:hypothetical protein
MALSAGLGLKAWPDKSGQKRRQVASGVPVALSYPVAIGKRSRPTVISKDLLISSTIQFELIGSHRRPEISNGSHILRIGDNGSISIFPSPCQPFCTLLQGCYSSDCSMSTFPLPLTACISSGISAHRMQLVLIWPPWMWIFTLLACKVFAERTIGSVVSPGLNPPPPF